jgi:hypothetical protein
MRGRSAGGQTVVTVEMACLKMSCSWLLASTTEYLSNPDFPHQTDSAEEKDRTCILSRRIVLRYTS